MNGKAIKGCLNVFKSTTGINTFCRLSSVYDLFDSYQNEYSMHSQDDEACKQWFPLCRVSHAMHRRLVKPE